MKLSWKLFFITTPIFILFLTVFGSWMIQENFQGNLDREIERCKVENQMFQNSYELIRHSLSEEQLEQTSVKQMVESFYRENNKYNSVMQIYDTDGTVLYQDSTVSLDHGIRKLLDEIRNVGYELLETEGRRYIVVAGLTSFGEIVETTKDITEIFQERSDLYLTYQAGILMLTVLVGGVILLVLFLVMRNMQKLSRATRQFAQGNYETRVKIRSQDEIGMLAEDFNWMANQMNQQMERLQDEVRRQEEFTAAFAHELKTPLTSIIGYADTIRQMELSPEETDMCADYIYHQGKRLQSLSYKLLDMLLAEKQEIVWKEISVPEFLQDVGKTVQNALDEKGIRLRIEAVRGFLYGDRELLATVFINLIDNARKASEPGTCITVSGKAMRGGYELTVADQGRGLPPEELSRITEAFYMVDKSRSRKEGGAGLGLALCRKILALHQATWQMESEPGKGLSVTVRFRIPDQIAGRRIQKRKAAVKAGRD